jgi:hypothetical protein
MPMATPRAHEAERGVKPAAKEELWQYSATKVLSHATKPSARVEGALARATATQLPGFVSCAETARAEAAHLEGDAEARKGDTLYGLPVVVDGSLCGVCWRRWGVACGLSTPIGSAEVAAHPVTQQLARSGAVLVGVSNASARGGADSGVVAAVACGNASVGCLIDTTRGGALGAAAAARIIALHPTPATVPHTIDPDGEHFAALHWHATLLAREVEDVAVLYDALYLMQGWGNVGVCAPPRRSLGGGSAPEPKGPPSARSAVSQGRAAAEGGAAAASPRRGFNRTAALKTVVARQAQALPTRVAWTVELARGQEGLGAACEAAAGWFEGVGARVDNATPGFGDTSALLQRCHGNECARARYVCVACMGVSLQQDMPACPPPPPPPPPRMHCVLIRHRLA